MFVWIYICVTNISLWTNTCRPDYFGASQLAFVAAPVALAAAAAAAASAIITTIKCLQTLPFIYSCDTDTNLFTYIHTYTHAYKLNILHFNEILNMFVRSTSSAISCDYYFCYLQRLMAYIFYNITVNFCCLSSLLSPLSTSVHIIIIIVTNYANLYWPSEIQI